MNRPQFSSNPGKSKGDLLHVLQRPIFGLAYHFCLCSLVSTVKPICTVSAKVGHRYLGPSDSTECNVNFSVLIICSMTSCLFDICESLQVPRVPRSQSCFSWTQILKVIEFSLAGKHIKNLFYIKNTLNFLGIL